jgi:hypothetical protein
MIVLPRLARALNHPGVAVLLAAILIAIGVIGLVTDDIKHGYAIGIIVIGVLNVLRAQPKAQEGTSAGSTS